MQRFRQRLHLKLMINRPVLTRRELRQPCVARYAPGGDRVVLLFEESSGSLRRGQMWRLGKDKCFCFVPHGILSWGAARVPLHVPSRKSMLQTHARFKCKIDIGNNRLQLYAPFSFCAESGFAVWEFGDLGSGVKVVDRRPGCPSHPPPIFSIAPPLARTLQTGAFASGFGENLTIAVLSSEAQARVLPCFGE